MIYLSTPSEIAEGETRMLISNEKSKKIWTVFP